MRGEGAATPPHQLRGALRIWIRNLRREVARGLTALLKSACLLDFDTSHAWDDQDANSAFYNRLSPSCALVRWWFFFLAEVRMNPISILVRFSVRTRISPALIAPIIVASETRLITCSPHFLIWSLLYAF